VNKRFLKAFYEQFKDDEVPALGAQITYYLILAFFPFLIFVITLISYTPLASNELLSYLARLLPTDTYTLVLEILAEVSASRSGTLLSIGVLATLWAASNAVMSLIRGLNKAYDQRESRAVWKLRAISLIFMVGLIIAILFSLGLLIFGKMLGSFLFNLLGHNELFATVWNLVRYLIPLAILMLVFAFLYVYSPNQRVRFREVWLGSLLATLGWIIISTAFSYYVNNFGTYSKTYGSLGGIIVLLIWLYWSSIIILIGGEVNAARRNENKA